MAFIERGKDYNHILEKTKALHEMAIEQERTDILNFNDWLLLQFFLTQMAFAEGEMSFKGETL